MRLSLPRRRRRVAVLTGVAMIAAGAGLVMNFTTNASAACADADVVVARGTGEPGNLGQIVGDPVFAALQQTLAGKNLTSYAVQYPASVAAGSAAIGNTDLVNHVMTQAAACPTEKFILVGYSQGANVVDNSLGVSSQGAVVGAAITATIPAQVQPQVSSVLLFGNPIRAQGKAVVGTFADQIVLDTCANNDLICQPNGASIAAHLSYSANAMAAAQFAASKF